MPALLRDPWKSVLLPIAVGMLFIPLLTAADGGYLEVYQANWPLVPAAFLAAFFANATAVGGGFLFVPLFLLLYDMPALSALVLSLATQAWGMTSGATGWSGKHIHRSGVAWAAAAGGIGMAIGTFAVTPTPTEVKGVFGWVSLIIGLALVVEMRWRPPERDAPTPGFGAGYAVACLLGGVVTAWVSIGIGEVVVLWLLVRQRVDIATAIGTGVAALAACSVVGFAFHAAAGAIPWDYLAFTAIGVTLGGRAGAVWGKWLEARKADAPPPRFARGWPAYSPLKAVFVIVAVLDGVGMLVHAALPG